MSIDIAIFAEEKNDIEVVEELFNKFTDHSNFKFHKKVGHGCGKLMSKCSAWSSNYYRAGVTHLIVLHDQDKNSPTDIRDSLRRRIKGFPPDVSVIVIPKEEIEAWLLCDVDAIKSVFKIQNDLKFPNDTSSISNPKEFLRDLVSRHSKSTYVNTTHNKRIAEAMSLSSVENVVSFQPLKKFLNNFF